MKNFLFLLVVVGFCRAEGPVRYDDYKVYRVSPQNVHQLNALRSLEDSYDFWSEASSLNRFVDAMVAPERVAHFEAFLKAWALETHIMINNVQQLIDQEQNYTMARFARMNWESYQTYDQINEWLLSLEQEYPTKVQRIIGGQSYEGRNIYGVRVSFKTGNRAVFLEGGIHAKEWISPATVTFILNQLLTNTDTTFRSIIESRDWYVFPIFNPDGYEFSQTSDRMWRKTRKPYGENFGADPNRNWNYHWMDGGASSDPSKETYAGSSAFSEPETNSLSGYINGIASTLDAYISFHSYSQVILIPFGHSGWEEPTNNNELHDIAALAVEKLAVRYNTVYDYENIPMLMGVASGSSIDWVAGVHRIRMVYTFELRDTGTHGFLLPADQIIPTGLETFDALMKMIEELNK